MTMENDNTGVVIDTLREAGYAWGAVLFGTFERWWREKNGSDLDRLSLQEFSQHCSDFFSQTGWGQLTIKDGTDGTAIAEFTSCWEAEANKYSGCHITTGLLSGFFGKFANHPLAVLELSNSDGSVPSAATPVRFALGNADTILAYAAPGE